MLNYDVALKNIREGLMVVDNHCRVLYFNKGYSRIMGYSLKEARGMPLQEICKGTKMPEVLERGLPMEESEMETVTGQAIKLYPIMENGIVQGGIAVASYPKKERAQDPGISAAKWEGSAAPIGEGPPVRINGTQYSFCDIAAESPASAKCLKEAKKMASWDTNVFLYGENGCGKELYAHSIHNGSSRAGAPFLSANCAAYENGLLEKKLFGCEEGELIGMEREGAQGLFELAENGTLFLDEISEMGLDLQEKLIRAIRQGKICRMGSREEHAAHVRLVFACNVNLAEYVEEGRFLQDLYKEMSAFALRVPPLRERRADIVYLIEKQLRDISIRKKKKVTISEEAKRMLICYDWPGNIRELKNVLEYGAALSGYDDIGSNDLPPTVMASRVKDGYKRKPLAETVKEFEREQIRMALRMHGDTVEDKKFVAKSLGISLATLYNKLNE